MVLENIKGVYTALITPFNEDDEVDYDGLMRNVEFQIESGIDGLVALGTTAETPTLTPHEKEQVLHTVIETANKRVPIIAGTGTNATRTTLEESKKAMEMGADGLLVVTPYYNKPQQGGIYNHFAEVAHLGAPVIVYNIPGRTGVNIETETLERIAELDNIIGVKEASGNISQIMDVIARIKRKHPNFSVMNGDDALTYPVLALGGDGVISVVSNLVPKHLRSIYRYCTIGDYENARRLHYDLLPLFQGAFIETNPAPIKWAMNYSGMAAGGLRQPLEEISLKNKQRLERILSDLASRVAEKPSLLF